MAMGRGVFNLSQGRGGSEERNPLSMGKCEWRANEGKRREMIHAFERGSVDVPGVGETHLKACCVWG